jgi:hypothetical protein
MRWATVVLPLVPVTPKSRSWSCGSPASAQAASAAAARGSAALSQGMSARSRLPVRQHRRRAALQRAVDEIVAVGLEPAQRREQRAGAGLARVDRDHADLGVARAAAFRMQPAGQLAELHAGPPAAAASSARCSGSAPRAGRGAAGEGNGGVARGERAHVDVLRQRRENRRGDVAAVVFRPLRLVDHHQRHGHGVFQREKADERGDIAPLQVMAVQRLLRGAGLAGDAHAGQGRFFPRARLDHAGEHLAHLGEHLGLDVPAGAHGHGGVEEDARLQQPAAVGDGAVGGEQLQRADRDLLPHRHRGEGAARPLRHRREDAGRFAGQPGAGARAEAEFMQVFAEAPVAHAQPELDHAHVGGFRHHLLDRHHAERLVVVDDLAVHLDLAHLAVDQLARMRFSLVERRDHGEGLEGGARLVGHLRDGVVRDAAGGRVIGRVARHRQHFTG